MRKIGIALLLGFCGAVSGQNLELTSGKDIKQPGKLNPALVGSGEELIRIISDFQLGESAQLMLEGRLPLRLGHYMVGIERTFTDEVSNNMINITYGHKSKGGDKKNIQWRYGGSLQFNQKSISIPGYDSTTGGGGYTYKDLDGEVRTLKTLDEIRTGLDYFDAQLGVNMSYKSLILGASVENFIGQNVSFDKSDDRKLPLTANILVGGFLNIGEKLIVFPSGLFIANKNDMYAKATLDLSFEKFNITTAYIQENDLQDLSAALGFRFKKTFAGIKYNHPLSSGATSRIQTDLPSFNLFLNSTLFKSRDLFKSDFAKKMKRFY
jgi:hypothetical protein